MATRICSLVAFLVNAGLIEIRASRHIRPTQSRQDNKYNYLVIHFTQLGSDWSIAIWKNPFGTYKHGQLQNKIKPASRRGAEIAEKDHS